MSDGSNIFDLDRFRAARSADGHSPSTLPSTGSEYRDALAHLLAALEAQKASTPLEQARIESGKAALRMAARLAAQLK